MKTFKFTWIIGLIGTLLLIIAPILLFMRRDPAPTADPWSQLPQRPPHVDHTALIQGTLETGPEATALCLTCHEDAAHEVGQTVHWTWESEPVLLPGRDELVTIGKKNQINNFCIGVQSNWTGCTRCHAGYEWEDASYDFTDTSKVDCLVCHADPSTYSKAAKGLPAEGVDLVAAAQSVRTPTRENCGSCHFNGGGGNAVKHGDLDETLYFPTEDIDVHMGRYDFQCVDCHAEENHTITGHSISVSAEPTNTLACTDCHSDTVHADERLNAHVETVACQTCHVPQGAVRDATKMNWDWSTAGQDIEEDPHSYLKIKGSFVYESNFMPEYDWFNGSADRYLLGDELDPTQVTVLNQPLGSIDDPTAKIWPFKIHRATQIYDSFYNYLIQPKTVGEGGYWTDFDWDQASRLGMETIGLPYSGEYGWAETDMYWPLTHMVQPKEDALQCADCHNDNGRIDWEALGYYGDPIRWGGRNTEQVGAVNVE